jgi:23S rRNA pseudouridine2605 synthase
MSTKKKQPIEAAAPEVTVTKKRKKQTVSKEIVVAEVETAPAIAEEETSDPEVDVVDSEVEDADEDRVDEEDSDDADSDDEESAEDDEVEEENDSDEDSDEDETDEDSDSDEDKEGGKQKAPRPPAKLDRLQKILAAAGVASRRHAEEMIEQGRVQVNGKVVTTLGTKADAGRDHIRVDGKLLHGAERLRYFVLNKPKGFVTTVKDPEGRPTVMQFFEKLKERLYPVGRLDYLSEGLLLVTNDGELAHKLTRAASGVEKTYLVKVAGQPSEDQLDILRGGVMIPRGKMGEGKVKTSPARIRQVRQGDNPWFEVVLIEGRNRELRKMFEEIGHFVEKIRRIGYGPLVLDQEPGNLRELDEQELDLLRKVAAGTYKTPKSKDVRRRNQMDAQLPTVKPGAAKARSGQGSVTEPWTEKPNRTGRPFELQQTEGEGNFRPRPSFGGDRSERPARPSSGEFRRPSGPGYRPAENRGDDRFKRPGTPGARFGSDRPVGRPQARPAWQKDARPTEGGGFAGRPSSGGSYGDRPSAPRSFSDRPAPRSFNDRPQGGRPFVDRSAAAGGTEGDRPSRPFVDKTRDFGDRPSAPRSFNDRPAKSFGDRRKPFGDRPERKAWSKPEDRKEFKRPVVQREDDNYDDLEPRKNIQIHIEPMTQEERPRSSNGPRPAGARPYAARPSSGLRGGDERTQRPYAARPSSDRPRPSFDRGERPSYDRPKPFRAEGGQEGGPKPFRSEGRPEGGMARRFTTSSGVPRAGGARPSSKPGKSGGSRPYGAGAGRGGSDSRPSFGAGRPSGGRPSGGGGYSRPGMDQGRPAFRRDEGDGAPRASRPFTPRDGGDSKPGWKPKTRYGGPGPSGHKPGGPRPGGGFKPGGSSRPGGFKGKPSGGRPGGGFGGKKRG